MNANDKEIYELMKQTIREYALDSKQNKTKIETLTAELEILKGENAALIKDREKSISNTLMILTNIKHKMFNAITDEYANIYNSKTI